MLELERQTFEHARSQLLRDNEGKYVLIKDSAVVGIFDTEAEAMAAGYAQLGHVAFMVRRITAVDTPVNFTSDIIGR